MHRQIAGKLTGPVTKWIVLVAVLLIAGVFGSLAGKLIDVQNNETSSWLPGSAESTKALDRLDKFQDEYDVGTTIVYVRDSGLSQADFDAIEAQAPKIEKLHGLTGDVVTPARAAAAGAPAGTFVSRDGKVAKMDFTLNLGDKLWEEMPDLAKKIRAITKIDGVKVYMAGAGGSTADQSSAFAGFDGLLLVITLVVVGLILLGTYRSPLLWLLPILCAAVGLGISMGLLYLLAKGGGITVNGQTQFILTVLCIGAGTDYALLLIARYREELRRHEDRHEAMAFALHRAAPAIIASATTVVIGLLCLLFADLNSTAGLGPANAIGVAITALVMLTLLPAILVILGRWVFWPFVPHFGSQEPTSSGLWARVGNRISVRPRAVWMTTAGILIIVCFGFLRLDTSGIPSDKQYRNDVDSVVGQKVLVEHGLADGSTPVQVVADADQAGAVREAMTGTKGINEPQQPIVVGDTALINAELKEDALAPQSYDAVEDVRAAVHAVPGAHALVSGWTAVTLDIQDASRRDTVVIIPIVLLAVLLILVGLLRSLLGPLLLIGTVIVSFAAAFGLSGLIFDFIYGHPEVEPGFPLFAFVFLVALGIDYNIFLMTRVREETVNHGTRRGALIALSSTGGVITSAGFVLAATFGALATMPLTFTLQLGTTIALGVLLDTIIVRSVLVTALNLDLGPKIWWPSKLDRDDRSDAPPPPAQEPELANA